VFDRAAEAESRPDAAEREGEHACCGLTGDHRRNLAPETVDAMTTRFVIFLETFGDSRPPREHHDRRRRRG